MRQITVKYRGACTNCGAQLEPGTPAMYEKMTGIFCIGHEPTEVEDIRAYRMAKGERRAARKIGKAERLEALAQQKRARFNELVKEDNIAFFTQPIDFPERRKVRRDLQKSYELADEAKEARSQADGITRHYCQVKGDKERARTEARDKARGKMVAGQRVVLTCWAANPEATILKVNEKTVRLQFDDGRTITFDILQTHIGSEAYWGEPYHVQPKPTEEPTRPILAT